jgi:hypothetical protein
MFSVLHNKGSLYCVYRPFVRLCGTSRTFGACYHQYTWMSLTMCVSVCFTPCLVVKLFDNLSPSSPASSLRQQTLRSGTSGISGVIWLEKDTPARGRGLRSLPHSFVLSSFEHHRTSPRLGYSGDTTSTKALEVKDTNINDYPTSLLSEQRDDQSAVFLGGILESHSG